jgi:hypothetical protein
MAQQITIDIVADTKKLADGVNDANKQVEGISKNLKGVAAAAGAAASAFVLKTGATFLKQGMEEAQDAKIAMNNAESAFGAGSVALQKITADAEKFGEALAIDNDDIIKLATGLGSRLPKDAQTLSAELVNLAYDIEAVSNGAITAEGFTNKLAKAFVDGEVSAKELQKIVPQLDDSTAAMAESMSKAGDNQGALSLVIDAAQKKYGNAAEKNVTSTQKFDTALANLKEEIGQKVLPVVEKLIGYASDMIKLFSALPDPVQDVLLVLAGIVAIGGPLLTFLASAKSAMATLGIISSTSAGGIGAAGVATNLLSGAMRALPILAIIGLIVLLVQNWDKVTAVVDKAWEAIKNFGEYAWDAIKGFGSQIAGWVSGIVNQIGQIPGKMLSVGKNIVRGLWDGITSMLDWFENRLANSFVGKTVSKVMNLFGVKSPSTVFAEIGENLVKGLSQGIDQAQKLANVSMTGLANATMAGFQPQLAGYGTAQAAPIQITINAGLGTDPYALGREVNNALTKYGKVSSRVVRG